MSANLREIAQFFQEGKYADQLRPEIWRLHQLADHIDTKLGETTVYERPPEIIIQVKTEQLIQALSYTNKNPSLMGILNLGFINYYRYHLGGKLDDTVKLADLVLKNTKAVQNANGIDYIRLRLYHKAIHALRKTEVTTVGKLREKSIVELASFRGIGADAATFLHQAFLTNSSE